MISTVATIAAVSQVVDILPAPIEVKEIIIASGEMLKENDTAAPSASLSLMSEYMVLPVGTCWADVIEETAAPSASLLLMSEDMVLPVGTCWADVIDETAAPSASSSLMCEDRVHPIGTCLDDVIDDTAAPSASSSLMSEDMVLPFGTCWADVIDDSETKIESPKVVDTVTDIDLIQFGVYVDKMGKSRYTNLMVSLDLLYYSEKKSTRKGLIRVWMDERSIGKKTQLWRYDKKAYTELNPILSILSNSLLPDHLDFQGASNYRRNITSTFLSVHKDGKILNAIDFLPNIANITKSAILATKSLTCKDGDKCERNKAGACLYIHVDISKPTKYDVVLCKFGKECKFLLAGKRCTYYHPKSDIPCISILRNVTCKSGDQCKFSHLYVAKGQSS